MKYKVGDKVWVVKPPVTSDGIPCIDSWTPRWGVIVEIDGGNDLLIDTGKDDLPRNKKAARAAVGRQQWWYYPEDIDVFLTTCQEALES